MNNTVIFGAVLLVLAQLVSADSSANLIVQKTLVSPAPDFNLFAKGKNFTVKIDVYNIGEGAAYEAQVTDSWPNTNFEVVEGEAARSWNEIAAGGHESFEFQLIPTFEGKFDGFRANVQYQPYADGPLQTGMSSGTFDMSVLPTDLFEKFTAKHYQEWAVFVFGAASSVVLPFAIWIVIQVQFPGGNPKKDN